MRSVRITLATAAILALGISTAVAAGADTRVSVGSPLTPFSQNKQNEPAVAIDAHNPAWTAPVLVSQQSSTTFSDKEQIWADNASSCPFFGNAYICWASYKSNSHGNAFPTPLMVARSRDGGQTWTNVQVGPASDNG